jgi:hypothetical protein
MVGWAGLGPAAVPPGTTASFFQLKKLNPIFLARGERPPGDLISDPRIGSRTM